MASLGLGESFREGLIAAADVSEVVGVTESGWDCCCWFIQLKSRKGIREKL